MAQQAPVILITGGAQGIGKGIAAHFLDKNWRVVILDQNAEAISACRQDFGDPDNLLLITMDVHWGQTPCCFAASNVLGSDPTDLQPQT